MFRLTIGAIALGLAGSAMAAPAEPPLRILITNDDGVSSEGIAALVAALHPVADVVVAAPAENNSGGSQSITIIGKPFRVDTVATPDGVPHFGVRGTPADSVIFGLLGPGKERPFDLVISGINKGENVGNAVPVSGTIGAARQAVMMGVPAIAVSQQYRMGGDYDFTVAARYTAALVQQLHRMGKAAPSFVNVNVPTKAKGVKLVQTGGSAFEMTGMRKIGDEQGGATYQVGFGPGGKAPAGTDSGELAAGYVTVSVLTTDADDRVALKRLARTKAVLALPAQ